MTEQDLTRRSMLRGALMATAAVASGFTIAECSRPAEAMPIPPAPDPALPEMNGNVEPAHTRRRWVYSYRRHGRRYRYRRRGYSYYYGGWYYPRPWWTFGPGIYLNLNL